MASGKSRVMEDNRLPRGSRGRLSLEKAEQTEGHRPQAQTPESIRRGEPRLVKRRGV